MLPHLIATLSNNPSNNPILCRSNSFPYLKDKTMRFRELKRQKNLNPHHSSPKSVTLVTVSCDLNTTSEYLGDQWTVSILRGGWTLEKKRDITIRFDLFYNSTVRILRFVLAQSCLTLCNPVDCNPPGFSVHGIIEQECWSGLTFPTPGIFLTQGSNLHLCILCSSLHWQANSLPLSQLGSPILLYQEPREEISKPAKVWIGGSS